MCTVSFVPSGNQVFLTSNRDEKSSRPAAEPPQLHKVFGVSLLYPKDGDKGGTWIAINKRADAGVLLNGALVTHQTLASYRLSRGHILPHVLSSVNPVEAFSAFDTTGIEPFTLVLYISKRLYECRWDGQSKSIQRLPENKPHIWSSATLYSPAMQQQRKAWFDQWIKETPLPSSETIFSLHRFGGAGNSDNGYVMNRNGQTLTVSITSVQLQTGKAEMTYHQLANNKTYRSSLSFSENGDNKLSLWFRRLSIRLGNWEYWPFFVVYTPIFPYWFWLCLKARSLFFFNAANPTIRYGGFLMESKKEIYDLLPGGSYPATVLVKKDVEALASIKADLKRLDLSFPLIAKPDIGLRGLGVKLLHSELELASYHHQSRVDYLLQAYVNYKNEVGIFYCRMPGNKRGQITGVVGKELLSITGDGHHTIEQLIAKENRYLLQWAVLNKSDPAMLTQVLNKDEVKLLVPYGNHSRGAKFIDLSNQVSALLRDTIDDLCIQIPGFYFGRLDIRYNNWEELLAGKNFSIIELNGAGSEPAHIYDPGHSIFFGWKEIIRHWNMLYRISTQNNKAKKAVYLSLKEGVQLFRENASHLKKIS